MGELQPSPGIGVFQTMFWVSLQVSGSAGSSGITPALGPRNCGHCACWAETLENASSSPQASSAARRILGSSSKLAAYEEHKVLCVSCVFQPAFPPLVIRYNF